MISSLPPTFHVAPWDGTAEQLEAAAALYAVSFAD